MILFTLLLSPNFASETTTYMNIYEFLIKLFKYYKTRMFTLSFFMVLLSGLTYVCAC